MTAESALSALLLSVQLAGVEPAAVVAPSVSGPRAASVAAGEADLPFRAGRIDARGAATTAPREIGRVALADIREAQDRAYERRPVGRGSIDFAAAIGPDYETWAKFRQGGVTRAHSMTALRSGVEDVFPVEPYRFTADGDTVHAAAAPSASRASGGEEASVPAGELLQNLYASAGHVVIDPVRYALLYEDGTLLPPAIATIRRDERGILWVGYMPAAQLKAIYWFLGVNGTLYGMRLEDRALVFYSEPVPGAKRASVAFSEIPLN